MSEPRVTIHMASSADGFIARKDGGVDWMQTSDQFANGETLDPEYIATFLKSIDCYVMGSRTYETALNFEAAGFGWAYGETSVFVLTSRNLPKRQHVQFYSGDLQRLVNDSLKAKFRNIWIVGGSYVAAEFLRLGLADEIRYSILPVLVGEGIPFFGRLAQDVSLHLKEVKGYKNGTVSLCYEVKKA
ncbi:MAG TPA: dihydrofolate reductase family protein [Opitutaceae bacterium]